MKKILVTGGAGYVGSVLVPKLLRKGYDVRVFDTFWFAEPQLFPPLCALEIVKGDLRDTKEVEKSLKNIDCVIHLAGISNDPCSDLSPELTKEINITATQRLIDLSRDFGISRFINASSSSVYGIREEPEVTEDLALAPLTVYSQSKAVIEEYLKEKRGKMTAVSVRSATVCGYAPRMRLDLTVNILTYFAMRKGKLVVHGGAQKRPNIHIEDITDLYADLIRTPAPLIDGEAFNAGKANHSIQEIADLVKAKVNPKLVIEKQPIQDPRSYHISSQKIKRHLDYVPRRPIENAIADIQKAFQNNRIPEPESDLHYNVRTLQALLS